jgi:hypothetical protein
VIGDPVKTSTVSIGSVDLDDPLIVIGSAIDVERIASPGNTVTLDAANEIILKNRAGNFAAEEFIIDGTLTFPDSQLDFERTFDSDLTLVASNSFDAKLEDGTPVASQRLRLTSGKTLTLKNADLLLDASGVSGSPAVGDIIPLITVEANLASYQFETARSFQLYRTTDLNGPFLPILTPVSVDHLSQVNFADPNPPPDQAFYQIKVLPED